MKYDLVEKASAIVTDPLVLVNLVSQRVRQLNSGRKPLIATRPSMGVADIALTEIIEGKIKIARSSRVNRHESYAQIVVDPGSAPPEFLSELLHEFAKLYQFHGGSGITFASEGTLYEHDLIEVHV